MKEAKVHTELYCVPRPARPIATLRITPPLNSRPGLGCFGCFPLRIGNLAHHHSSPACPTHLHCTNTHLLTTGAAPASHHGTYHHHAHLVTTGHSLLTFVLNSMNPAHCSAMLLWHLTALHLVTQLCSGSHITTLPTCMVALLSLHCLTIWWPTSSWCSASLAMVPPPPLHHDAAGLPPYIAGGLGN